MQGHRFTTLLSLILGYMHVILKEYLRTCIYKQRGKNFSLRLAQLQDLFTRIYSHERVNKYTTMNFVYNPYLRHIYGVFI